MIDYPSTRGLVDPELLPLLDILPNFDLSAATLPAIRAKMADLAGITLPLVPSQEVAEGPNGPVSVLWYNPVPEVQSRAALLHIHGGGMVMGSALQMRDIPARLATALNIPVASVEYRLAPETPFPGPQEDCFAALCWLAQNAVELGVDPDRIAVTGESAGGGLAAAIAQIARDRDGPKLVAQILVYPMLDHRVGGDADPWCNRRTGEFVWTRSNNRFGWASLQGNYVCRDKFKGWFSPSIADDLSGLPPTWIGVGNLDLFFDENLESSAGEEPLRLQSDTGFSLRLG